jgi:hypothetical protein
MGDLVKNPSRNLKEVLVHNAIESQVFESRRWPCQKLEDSVKHWQTLKGMKELRLSKNVNIARDAHSHGVLTNHQIT